MNRRDFLAGTVLSTGLALPTVGVAYNLSQDVGMCCDECVNMLVRKYNLVEPRDADNLKFNEYSGSFNDFSILLHKYERKYDTDYAHLQIYVKSLAKQGNLGRLDFSTVLSDENTINWVLTREFGVGTIRIITGYDPIEWLMLQDLNKIYEQV